MDSVRVCPSSELVGALMDDLRHAEGVPGARTLDEWLDLFVLQVRNEWTIAGRDQLRSVAIVDDAPEGQFLRLEFEMAADALRDHGIHAVVVPPEAAVSICACTN